MESLGTWILAWATAPVEDVELLAEFGPTACLHAKIKQTMIPGRDKKDVLPKTDSLDGLVKFFETHDMGDYWDQLPEADLDIEIRQHKHLVALDDDLAGKVAKIARSRHVSSEFLINALLREKLIDAI
jgi:hypothetical protein